MREIVRVFLDGGAVRDELKLSLKKVGERARMVVFYVGREQDELDLKYQIKQMAPETKGEIYVYGVLVGAAQKKLQMEIEFCRGAKGAFGEEREEVMLLSEKARNMSLPMMLCGEEEARGVHGASVGRIDEAEVLYLKSRGIDERTAREMLVRAKLMQGLGKIEDEKVRESVRKQLEAVEYKYD
ncbi:SufD family Fe-S cluster assembly protein [Candidatus Saccharibacteria bacterium]|nr:SufD family Fe-S cluster assembly protein [Candidatus Saccharibacteria bacterium]